MATLTNTTYRRINIPNHSQQIATHCFIAVSGTVTHAEHHTQSWTITEHGKVKISDV